MDTLEELEVLQQQMRRQLQRHWRLFLAEGLFFIVLGLLAILVPHIFSVVMVIFLGWLILFGGVVQMARALLFSNMPGFGLWLAMGVLQIILGYLLIAKPIAGVVTLTMLITLFFAVEGTVKIMLAFTMRPLANWRFMLFSGMTALIFAVIVWISWPETAHWLLGLLLGINMVFMGWSLVRISLHHKDGP
jgi:uncharacterized membrane protein HdeD (DUF308 family)